jgi:hypothetical protein
MVYGDISPNNIFISEGMNDTSVWLIDADNIRFEILAGGSVVYTKIRRPGAGSGH